jgi:hypothetical protein
VSVIKRQYVIIKSDPVGGAIYEGIAAANDALQAILDEEMPDQQEQYGQCKYAIRPATESEIATGLLEKEGA